jgi:hypothetical protein
MRYVEFLGSIERELRQHPAGLTWVELKERLALPYAVPCPTWVKRLEEEIGLTRVRAGRSKVWALAPAAAGATSSPTADQEGR